MKVALVYKGPIPAPVKKGMPVGKVIVTVPGEDIIEVPVLAGADVEQLGLLGRLWSAVSTIMLGDIGS